jgi:ribonuclease VapC
MVVDSSALLAVILGEAEGEAILDLLAKTVSVRMSAATLTETLIVASRLNRLAEAESLIAGLGIEIMPLMPADAVRAADAYRRWGRGFHPAGFNFGDSFAYAAAKAANEPLLFVGNDFAQTDVVSAGPPPRTSTS